MPSNMLISMAINVIYSGSGGRFSKYLFKSVLLANQFHEFGPPARQPLPSDQAMAGGWLLHSMFNPLEANYSMIWGRREYFENTNPKIIPSRVSNQSFLIRMWPTCCTIEQLMPLGKCSVVSSFICIYWQANVRCWARGLVMIRPQFTLLNKSNSTS